ncbi:MAG: hypothetical protein QW156_04910 [Candidatus Aenigmatarchaeota archaeon]
MKVLWIIVCLFLIFALAYFIFQPKEENKTFTEIPIKPGENEVFIYADRIEPLSLNVKIGEEIKFTNKDLKEHTIAFSNPPLEKRILAGDTFTFYFSSSGIVEVIDKGSGAKITITIS